MSPQPLTDRQRIVLELREGGAKSTEIAVALGIAATAVRSRLHEARRKLGVPLVRHDPPQPPYNPAVENYLAVRHAYSLAPDTGRDGMLVGALMTIVTDDLTRLTCSFVGGDEAHDGPVTMLKDLVGQGKRPVCDTHRRAVLKARQAKRGVESDRLVAG